MKDRDGEVVDLIRRFSGDGSADMGGCSGGGGGAGKGRTGQQHCSHRGAMGGGLEAVPRWGGRADIVRVYM